MLKRVVSLTLLVILWSIAGCEASYSYLGDAHPAACQGECAPPPPPGFDGPVLLWAGDPAEVPGCPDEAPAIVFEGYEGLADLPAECAPCACSQPKCKLPAGIIGSSYLMCYYDGPEAILTPFLAPDSWDGSCVTPTPIPMALRKVTTNLPSTEVPCAPVVEVPERAETGLPFTTRARACGGAGAAGDGPCQGGGHACAAGDDAPAPGFRRCIMSLRPEEASCPAEYPDQLSFFAEVADTRSCAPCTCTQVTPSDCWAHVQSYQDPACIVHSLGMTIGFESACHTAGSDLPLQSLDAYWVVNQPGACVAGGGEPTGAVSLRGLQTFCCVESE